MKRFIIGVFILIGISIASCTKIDFFKPAAPVIPKATQNGSNTMGAYVNGTIWEPLPSFYSTGIISDYGGTAFSIYSVYENTAHNGKTSIYISISNFTGTGSYVLNETESAYGNTGGVSIIQDFPGKEYATDSLHQGSLVITHFDPAKRIVSGTFQISAVNQKDPTDVIQVTGGRFDFTCPLNTIE
jgi:hypothetical protein